jgi:hypothetical protein
VYRDWGRDPTNPDLAPSQSGPWGQSWTRVDPASVAKYRDVAGLPDEANLGRFVSQGILQDTTGVEARQALQLGANVGGLDEMLIPNPEAQIALELMRVMGGSATFWRSTAMGGFYGRLSCQLRIRVIAITGFRRVIR